MKGLLILLLAWLVLPWLYGIYDAHTTASGFNRELHDLIYPGQMLAEAESVKIPVQEE